LNERLSMLNHSNVEWIELFPGNFGMEAKWKGWQEPRSCHPERLQECVQNTKTMREAVRTALKPIDTAGLSNDEKRTKRVKLHIDPDPCALSYRGL
jgi:hypothetical protein